MTAPISLTLQVEICPDQQLTYIHVPFDVPEGIERIDVRYGYDHPISSDPTITDGNTIDIGLFDPRGIDFSSAGFRGWTGSAHQAFSLGTDSATPGYMPGEIQAGTWHICLGAYKVAADGCRCQVDIVITPADVPKTAAFPTLLRLSDEERDRVSENGWYRGELHCHTVNSDGDSTPEEIVRLAESHGLDFLAVTDHNNRTQQIDLARIDTPLILIPGYEITTYYGHFNVWGDGRWIDFRVTGEADMKLAQAQALEAGYLVSCNHPRPYGPDWVFPNADAYECVEVWNGPWELLNSICLAYWERELMRGRRVTAVGGSDHHFSKRAHIAKLGTPTTWIYCEGKPSARKLIESIRAGCTAISASPDGARIDLRVNGVMVGGTVTRDTARPAEITVDVSNGEGMRLTVIGDGQILTQQIVTAPQERLDFSLDLAGMRYVRAQLESASSVPEVFALTSAVWISNESA